MSSTVMSVTESTIFAPDPSSEVVQRWPMQLDLFVDDAFGDAETAPPCPVVAVPAANRPAALVVGSRHPAVGEVQRKLNAFHRYRSDNAESGLPHAPLVPDCGYGPKTRDAVRAFQVIAIPDEPKQHDGKVGVHTWAQLDAITIGPGDTAEVTVSALGFLDAVDAPLGWDQIIGLHTTGVTITLTATGIPSAAMPAELPARLSTHPANLILLPSITPISLQLKRSAVPVGPGQDSTYRATGAPTELAGLLADPTRGNTAATVGRRGATSDAVFRTNLAGVHRGSATQPASPALRTHDESTQTPDAFDLLRAGGVQVLELSLLPRPHWRAPSSVHRLCRSAAKYLYYSGHGLSASGKLVIDVNGRRCGEGGSAYQDWLGPADLASAWRRDASPEVLIIAGCSMLKINLAEFLVFNRPVVGPGVEWAKLLSSRGGTLTALLGYGAKAPCDVPVGDRIAEKLGQRIRTGTTDVIRDWLTINGDANANNAAAIDNRGFWWIESTLLGGYKLRGPLKLP
jgi:peptidoglycan hydrolase-like protein with peptidoglycan-binding domain